MKRLRVSHKVAQCVIAYIKNEFETLVKGMVFSMGDKSHIKHIVVIMVLLTTK